MSAHQKSNRFLWGFLAAALLIAVVGSYYASSHPDGLEYVAEKTGFLHSAEDSATADSPFADYAVKGVDDERLSVGLSGLIGCAVVLLIAGGGFWVLRRRQPERDGESDIRTGTR